jgi:hypothetical protein
MNAESELLNAYREWHRLAEAETKAIRTRNWDLLSDCHLAIKDLQAHMAPFVQEARAEWKRAGILAEKERNVQVMVAGLIDLTRQNQILLESARTAAGRQVDELGEAGKNLHRLRRSYGALPA